MAIRFNRHVPRICLACAAPMARQEDSCWNCGAAWVDPVGRPTGAGPSAGLPADVDPQPDTDRWADEGGSVPSEPSVVLPLATHA